MLGCLRPAGHLLRAMFLITLPVTLLPFLNGLMEGVLVANLMIASSRDGSLFLDQELQAAAALYESQQRLGTTPRRRGGASVSDTPLPPFHVPRVWAPTDWWAELGLDRFELLDPGSAGPTAAAADAVVDYTALASLEGLYRKANWSDGVEKPWHHWVYASPRAPHVDGAPVDDEWDKAFEQLVQHRNAHPAIASANFHYISCPGSYLCTAWMVKGPALIHFTTEPLVTGLDVWTEEEEFHPNYEAATARIIDLPITETRKLGLPGMFPSPFNQLRALTGESSPWRLFEPYSRYGQFLSRAYDLLEASKRDHPVYGALSHLEDAVLEFLAFEDSKTAVAANFVAVCITAFVRLGVDKVLNSVTGSVQYDFENHHISESEDN